MRSARQDERHDRSATGDTGPKITFLGAAREVTGSRHLVETGRTRFLVDCGLFQGGRGTHRRNATALRALPHLDFVLVSHAHLDHCGLLPLLVRSGFAGPIYATPATVDLLDVMLRDSAAIQEKDALWRRKHGRPANDDDDDPDDGPLYTTADVEATLGRVHGMPYDRMFSPRPDVRFRFRDAGHIIGSAIIETWIDAPDAAQLAADPAAERGTKIVFSGDLGQPARPVVRDPAPIERADVLVVESTYGNRLHRGMDETVDELVAVMNEVIHERRGNVLVPAFALGRTQELLTLLVQETQRGRLRDLDVYVDSPLAAAATRVTLRHRDVIDPDARAALTGLERTRLPIRVHFIESPEESKRLNSVRGGAVIIAGSGMCDGGRIRNHLQHHLGRPECAVLFTGFQAAGTLGRRIVDGAEWVRIYGVKVPVAASVHTLGGLSAHADRDALLAWLGRFTAPPARTFVVHGEEATALGFADTVRATLGWTVDVPAPGDAIEVRAARSD